MTIKHLTPTHIGLFRRAVGISLFRGATQGRLKVPRAGLRSSETSANKGDSEERRGAASRAEPGAFSNESSETCYHGFGGTWANRA